MRDGVNRMSARSASRWVVVKFGGTSVSTLANWRNIAGVVHRRLEKDLKDTFEEDEQ